MSLSNNINRNRPPWRQRWSECTKRLQRQRERQWASPQLLNPSQLNLQSLSPWRPNRLHLNLRWWMVSILRWILTPTAISTLITTITSILILINNLNNKLDCVFYSCWSLYSWNPLRWKEYCFVIDKGMVNWIWWHKEGIWQVMEGSIVVCCWKDFSLCLWCYYVFLRVLISSLLLRYCYIIEVLSICEKCIE